MKKKCLSRLFRTHDAQNVDKQHSNHFIYCLESKLLSNVRRSVIYIYTNLCIENICWADGSSERSWYFCNSFNSWVSLLIPDTRRLVGMLNLCVLGKPYSVGVVAWYSFNLVHILKTLVT